MVGRSRVMRFSFDLVNGVSRIGAHWMDDENGITHRQFFFSVSEFETWLVTTQGYGPDEVATLVAQVCSLQPPPSGNRPPDLG